MYISGAQGSQGYDVRLSTTSRFEILREVYGLRRFVCVFVSSNWGSPISGVRGGNKCAITQTSLDLVIKQQNQCCLRSSWGVNCFSTYVFTR